MITRTHEGAGALSTAPDAFTDSASRQPAKVRHHSIPNSTRPALPRPLYSPVGVRRCRTCDSTTNWTRLQDGGRLAGGWFCPCGGRRPEAQRAASDLTHTCDRSCLLAAGGAA